MANNVKYRSGNYSVATAISLPEFSAPLAGVNANYLLKQKFQQKLDSFTPLPLSTSHPDFLDFILVAEGDKQDIHGNVVQWERTYAAKPATYSEPGGLFAYNFIGYVGASQTSGAVVVFAYVGRLRFTRNVHVNLTRQFFRIGPGVDDDYATVDEIPTVDAQRYTDSTGLLDLDYIADSPPLATATIPNRTDYEALIAADETDDTSYSLVVEASTLIRWMGNIFMVETRTVKAQ